MGHGSLPKSRLAAAAFGQELFVGSEPAPFLTLRANGRTLNFFLCCCKSILQKLGRMQEPLMPKFRPDPSVRLKDIFEKQVPVKLKPIVETDIAYCTALYQYRRMLLSGVKPAAIQSALSS